MKNINDVTEKFSKGSLFFIIAVLFGIISSLSLSAYLWKGHFILKYIKDIEHGLFLGCAFIFIVLFAASFYISRKFENEAFSEYRKYLQSHPKECLIQASSSPEMDCPSKESIIHYLNSNHKGWSLEQ